MIQYPGKSIALGSSLRDEIKAVQVALAAIGLGVSSKPGFFDAATQSAVKLFQSRNVDSSGQALKVDGIVGRFTWVALFGTPQQVVPVDSLITALPAQVLAAAISQIGVMEDTGKPNRGLQVDAYLAAAGIAKPGSSPPGGYPWCQAFVYWCFVQAAKSIKRPDQPAPKTAGVLDHWNKSATNKKIKRITKVTATADLSLVKPGMIFVNDYGTGLGHTGFIERVYPDGRLVTIEGNTNLQANREGLGVYRLERRKLNDKELKGFLDYSQA